MLNNKKILIRQAPIYLMYVGLQKTKLEFLDGICPQYLTLKVSDTKFPGKFSIDGHSAHNNEQIFVVVSLK